MNNKYFKIFSKDAQEARDWIALNSWCLYEVNSEVFSCGKVIVKYRTLSGLELL